MHIQELCGKKICILGFGREGQATLRAIQKYVPDADITIADRSEDVPARCQVSRSGSEDPSGSRTTGVRFQVGTEYLRNLHHFDTIIKSPGIPPHVLLTTNYKLLTTPTQIFFDSIANSGATVIGVTGSKGKSTTASLIYEILRAAPHPSPLPRGEGVSLVFPLPLGEGQGEGSVYLIGNIGTPALDFLEKAKPGAIVVMELSSYQLADLTVSPHIAVITSFFPEHLDYHGSLEAYREAKRNICRFQRETNVVFYASQAQPPHPRSHTLAPPSPPLRGRGKGEGAHEIAMMSPGTKVPFSEADAPVTLEETHLIGKHNLRNIAGAWKVAEHRGVPRDVAIDAIRAFRPLPHRLQSLGVHHGIEWVDDAISTTPESTIAALDALGDRVTTIILGGLDRGYDFHALAERIVHSQVRTVILLTPKNTDSPSSSSPRIREELTTVRANVHYFEAKNMEEAVSAAKNETTNYKLQTTNSPIVLLSTASPSYGMFKNFEEKGACFQKAIAP